MPIQLSKQLALVEDIEFGMDVTTQDRGGNQLNASYIPYSLTESVTQALDVRYTGAYVEANFAHSLGDELLPFMVQAATNDNEAVNKAQLDLKEDITVVANKADKANVLELDNDISYAPAYDYNPSTKKYVDDSIYASFQSGVTGSFTAGSGETVTVINGLITGII